MNKKIILVFGILLAFIFMTNLVSAALCLGEDRYYHDCDDARYFDDKNNNYADEYYYHGNYYPARDYYYREYYKPRCQSSKCYTNYQVKDYYKETEEYIQLNQSMRTGMVMKTLK